jgi:hypothetical protein
LEETGESGYHAHLFLVGQFVVQGQSDGLGIIAFGYGELSVFEPESTIPRLSVNGNVVNLRIDLVGLEVVKNFSSRDVRTGRIHLHHIQMP